MKKRENKVKIKATKCTIIIDVIVLLILLLDQFMHPSSAVMQTILILSLMIFITWLVFKVSLVAFSLDENEENKQFVESVLSSQEYTEVIPIKPSEYEEFICGLTDIAKFYAIIDEEDKVKISVKFNNENEFRMLESFSKEYFKEYYKLADKIQNQQAKN